jgi:hypothetical protein
MCYSIGNSGKRCQKRDNLNLNFPTFLELQTILKCYTSGWSITLRIRPFHEILDKVVKLTEKRHFTTLTPGSKVIKTFSPVTYECSE